MIKRNSNKRMAGMEKQGKQLTGKEIAELVRQDIKDRISQPEKVPSAEDALMDAYHQSLDICMEIRGWIEERDNRRAKL